MPVLRNAAFTYEYADCLSALPYAFGRQCQGAGRGTDAISGCRRGTNADAISSAVSVSMGADIQSHARADAGAAVYARAHVAAGDDAKPRTIGFRPTAVRKPEYAAQYAGDLSAPFLKRVPGLYDRGPVHRHRRNAARLRLSHGFVAAAGELTERESGDACCDTGRDTVIHDGGNNAHGRTYRDAKHGFSGRAIHQQFADGKFHQHSHGPTFEARYHVRGQPANLCDLRYSPEREKRRGLSRVVLKQPHSEPVRVSGIGQRGFWLFLRSLWRGGASLRTNFMGQHDNLQQRTARAAGKLYRHRLKMKFTDQVRACHSE